MKEAEAINVHLQNLREFNSRAEISAQQRELTISEIADILVRNREGEDDSIVYNAFKKLVGSADASDLAAFAMKLSESKAKGPRTRDSGNVQAHKSVAPGAHGKIAMVQNEYCKAAFGILSKTVKNPKQVFCTSFTESCEAVVYNSAEFALLPIESIQDGKLFGFYSMIDVYELMICSSCLLEGERDTPGIRYALVGKGGTDRPSKTKKLNYEFSLISDSGCFPTDAINAAAAIGAKILKVDSMPVLYDNTQQKFYFTLGVNERIANALDIYLSEEYKGYTKIGAYPIL